MKHIFSFFGGVFFFFIWSFSVLAFAQMTLETDTTEIHTNEAFVLHFATQSNKALPALQSIPGFEHFTIIQQSNQSRMQAINGKSVFAIRYTFTLQPKKDGMFSIGPIVMHYEDTIGITQKVQSNSITIKVSSSQPTQNIQQTIKETSILQPLSFFQQKPLALFASISIIFLIIILIFFHD